MIDHQQPQQNVRFKEYFSYTRPGSVDKKSLRYLRTNTGYQGDLTASYAWNGEGRMQSVQYPNIWNGSQVIADVGYGLGYDSMGRPAEMAAFGGGSVVNGVQYGPANELLQMTWLGRTEYRTYNSRLQMTRVRVTPYGTDSGMDIEYIYPNAPANNGRISSQKNGTWSLLTETLSYQYDSWNRLTYAAGPDFTQSMNYDGFGNLTARVGTGTAPSSSTPVNPANNQLSGVTYDANGNEQRTGWVWDAENHLAAAGGKLFFYDSSNRKVWEGVWNGSTWASEKLHFYGVDGRRMSSYAPVLVNGVYVFSGGVTDAYFGGKRLALEDRLGSDFNGRSDYFPYGETRFTYSGQTQRFATYTRDNSTGLDYAINRHYMPGTGRFTSADPYRASGGPAEPGSWNRYAYVGGEVTEYNDPEGLFKCKIISYGTNNGMLELHCTSPLQRLGELSFHLDYTGSELNSYKSFFAATVGSALDWLEAYQELTPIIKKAQETLKTKEDCRKLFSGTNISALDLLDNFWERVIAQFGDVVGPSGRPAYAVTRGLGLFAGGNNPISGGRNAMVSMQFDVGLWEKEPDERLLTFFHEMGHAIALLGAGRITGGFQHGGAENWNDKAIRARCLGLMQ